MAAYHYRILEQVGVGQFGRVYCAIAKPTGTIVALKDLDQLTYPTKKFLREILYLVTLQHPNIVAFNGFEHHKRGRYLILDYCSGGTLRDLMDSQIQLSLRYRVKLVKDILSGLDHAHRRGIVHCDIKPENILLEIDANGWRAKLTDFGIARLTEEAKDIRECGGYTGSPAYMAPERFYGQYSCASDLYAIGILLYELIVGERPFSGLPGELMSAHMSQSVTVPALVPSELRSIIEIALRKLPQRRFHSAGEMLNSLDSALKKLPSVTENYTLPPLTDLPIFSAYRVIFAKRILDDVTSFTNSITHLYCIKDNQIFRDSIDKVEKVITRLTFPHRVIKIECSGDRCWIWTGSKSQIFLYSCSRYLEVNLLAKFSVAAVFSNLDINDRWLAVNQYRLFMLLKLPQMKVIEANRLSQKPSQLLWLDRRHGLTIHQEENQTKLGLFNRRGHWLDGLTLPISCHNFIVHKFRAYYLLCSESHHPSTLVIINLKPWRMMRIPLREIPNYIISYRDGFILAYLSGEAVFLDINTYHLSYCHIASSIKYISSIDRDQFLVINDDNLLQIINING